MTRSREAFRLSIRKSQYRYAMTYVVITLVVLLILNIYCSIACQNLFYESKKSSMIEKCLLASDEVSTLVRISLRYS